jgi:hypothetical protein
MLKREVLFSKNKHTVSFFEDDSIETVRLQIGKSLNIHPDRLLIFVAIKLENDYYEKDPRRWESLFERLSYNGKPLEKIPFEEYQTGYRFPNTAVPFQAYDKAEWMDKPEALKPFFSEAIEYRILGVPEMNSFVLPFEINNALTSRIEAVRLPIPQLSTLLSSMHLPEVIDRFMCIEHTEAAPLAYFPFYRDTTPQVFSEEVSNLLTKNTKLLNGLLTLKTEEPSSISIIRTRFYVPFVETDFGSAVRTRFEQIFYGLTVSAETPYIGLFTSKDQVNRHKFFVENPKSKLPVLDMAAWNSWWSLTKPSRGRPTLVLYRGKSKNHFDRIAISSIDMVVSTYRPEGNTETIPEFQKSMLDWIKSLDSVLSFLNTSDIHLDRWELQDMTFVAKYDTKLDDFDLRRFNCISSIYNIVDKGKSQFRLLRTDNANDGLSAIEIKLLQMMKSGDSVTANAVAEELSIPLATAREIILTIQSKLDEDPRLGQKSFRGYPTFNVGSDFVLMTATTELKRSLQYSNLLRFILSDVESPALDSICPKRVEKVAADTTIVPTTEETLNEEYLDLFSYAEGDEEETASVAETVTSEKRISTDQHTGTNYNYFKNRLQQFDPVTFNPVKSLYPKKCEQKHQPIILSEADLKRVSGTPYDPKAAPNDEKMIDIENPTGTILCPEYWCMKDQIPLQESQLIDGKCPVCKGKLQTKNTDSPREFPLVKRESGFVYPGYVDYKSPANGEYMPCCFKKSRVTKIKGDTKENEDKYYVLGDLKTDLSHERAAFLSPDLIHSLHIFEKYEMLAKKRLVSGISGFFRVGMGSPVARLPHFLGLKTKILSPAEAPQDVIKCSFFRTWKTLSDKPVSGDYSKEIKQIIAGIDEAYRKGELSQLEELEYAAVSLQCDVFRIFLDSNSLGCLFYTQIARPRSRGIIVLQRGSEINILSNVLRVSRGFEYKSNIFEAPFSKKTASEVETLRNESCRTKIPSYDDALNVMKELGEEYSIILDPFHRGQALFVPGKAIIPFQSIPIPEVAQVKISGYSEITELPSYEQMVEVLERASKIVKGYSYKEDLYNGKNQRTEILTESGLRIPVMPSDVEKPVEASEVIETVNKITEEALVFGVTNENADRQISYSSEVYEFLIFQLAKDLKSDYNELRVALQEVKPNLTVVRPLLEAWFDQTANFVEISDPQQFISKIRSPCGQFTKDTCSSNLCGWNGTTCGIKISNTLKKQSLFGRILSTMVDNSKIRATVLDGRVTPFFSTILYMELPHELIVTDMELPT